MLKLSWLRHRLVFGKPAKPPETVDDVRVFYARVRKLCDQTRVFGLITLGVLAVTLPFSPPGWIEHMAIIVGGTAGLCWIQMYRQLTDQTEYWFVKYMEQIEKTAIATRKYNRFVDLQFQLRVDMMMMEHLARASDHGYPIVRPSKGMPQ
jgi:hypothetical protein